jgi:hypothetical protein
MLNYPWATFRDCPDFAIGHSGQAGKPCVVTNAIQQSSKAKYEVKLKVVHRCGAAASELLRSVGALLSSS